MLSEVAGSVFNTSRTRRWASLAVVLDSPRFRVYDTAGEPDAGYSAWLLLRLVKSRGRCWAMTGARWCQLSSSCRI